MNINDLALGYDPTAQPYITGGELASLITTATPSSDRGIVLWTADDAFGNPTVPNASTTPEFQRYIWIRLQGNVNGFAVYVWNPNQTNGTAGPNNVSLLNWNPIALGIIPIGSIQNTQLAGGITFDKITSVSFSSIINNANIVLNTTALTGVITGTIATGLTIGAGQITAGMLLSDGSVGSPTAPVVANNIKGGAVTLSKLDQTGSVGQFLTAQGVGVAPSWTTLGTIKYLQTVRQSSITSAFIAYGLNGANTQILTSAAPSIKFTAANPGVLTNVGTGNNYQTGLPLGFNTSGKAMSSACGIACGITPLSLTSYLLVEMCINVFLSQADLITVCLYGFGNASASALPSATVANGVAVINNNGGSSSTAYQPLPTYSTNGLAIRPIQCVIGLNSLYVTFMVNISAINPSLSYPTVLVPFIGTELNNTAIGFNSNSTSAGVALYGGSGSGPLESWLQITEILV